MFIIWGGLRLVLGGRDYLASIDLGDSQFRAVRRAAVMSTALVSPQRHDVWLKMSKDVKNKKVKKKPYQAH